MFQYSDATIDDAPESNGKSATVGIQGLDTAGINYQANEGVLSDALAILFSPPSASFVGINASMEQGNPGDDVTHRISVFNRTGADQDFAIALMPGNQWATTLPATTGLILDGDSASFDLTVSIPTLNDLPPLIDLATIQVSGNGVSAVQNIITQSFPGQKFTNDAVRSSTNPSISGSGNRVAFQSRADLIPGSNPSFRTQVFVINSNGTGLVQLTDDAVGSSTNPSISGSGNRVAFRSSADLIPGSNPNFLNQIFTINSNGTNLRQIAQGNSPSLSGDGSRVAFRLSGSSVAVMNGDGTGDRVFFNQPQNARNPSLSSDGALIALDARVENGIRQIYLLETAKADADKDGVLDSLEGSSADNAAAVLGLTLNTGGTVDITLPAGQRLAAVASGSAVGGPFDVPFPFGTLSYRATSAIGGSTTASLSFSSPLPDPLNLYKVDLAGVFTEMPTTLWTKTGPNSLNVTLTDGGAFDLDGVANGVIIDPIAIGNPPVPTTPTTNTEPSVPSLLSPENGATDVGTDATFSWKASTDAEDDSLSYTFFICENNTFTGTGCDGETVLASLKTGLAYAAVFGGSTGALFLIGMVFTGRITRKQSGLLFVSLMMTTLLVSAGCSSGGGSSPGGGGRSSDIRHQVSGMTSGTSYFWKVVVSDGQNSVTSEVRSFTTR